MGGFKSSRKSGPTLGCETRRFRVLIFRVFGGHRGSGIRDQGFGFRRQLSMPGGGFGDSTNFRDRSLPHQCVTDLPPLDISTEFLAALR